MRIPSGTTDQVIYFVAVDATDFTSRETGLSSFTVYRSRNGGTAAAFTTPTLTEVDATNMPGVYTLLLDEDMTIDSGDDSQEMAFHITHAGMAPVTRTIELYRPKITVGETLTVSSGDVGVYEWNSVSLATTNPLPNAAPDAAGGLVVSDTGGADIDTLISTANTTAANVAAILADTGTDGVVIAAGQSVASVSGAVGSVTGNVGGNVTGSVGSISGVTFPTNFADLAITASTGYITVGGFLGGALTETTGGRIAGNFDTFFENGDAATSKVVNDVGVAGSGLTAQQVWEYDISAIATAGYAGKIVNDIVADTNELQTNQGNWLTATTVDLNADQSGVTIGTVNAMAGTITTLDALDTAQDSQHSTTQAAVAALSIPTAAAIRTEIDSNSTQLAAILADTNELQTDWADGGRLDLLLDTASAGGGGGDATAANQTTIINAIGTLSDLGSGATIADNLSDMAGASFSSTTDSQEAIRNRGDAAWSAAASSPVLIQNTTIATLASQTSFTLTDGSTDDDAYNGLTIIITDSATSTQKAVGTIDNYIGSTKTVTLRLDPGVFTMATGDTVDIVAVVNGAVNGSATGVGWLG